MKNGELCGLIIEPTQTNQDIYNYPYGKVLLSNNATGFCQHVEGQYIQVNNRQASLFYKD
ncbi:MAG: hypothetical protein AABX11_00160 [Nanoarchaeota archaeon]